jgi:hypothetical protein
VAKIENGEQLAYLMEVLYSAGLTDQISILLGNPDMVAKIQDGFQLGSVMKALYSAGLTDQISILLGNPDMVAKIENGKDLFYVTRVLFQSAKLTDDFSKLLANPRMTDDIKCEAAKVSVLIRRIDIDPLHKDIQDLVSAETSLSGLLSRVETINYSNPHLTGKVRGFVRFFQQSIARPALAFASSCSSGDHGVSESKGEPTEDDSGVRGAGAGAGCG